MKSDRIKCNNMKDASKQYEFLAYNQRYLSINQVTTNIKVIPMQRKRNFTDYRILLKNEGDWWHFNFNNIKLIWF